MWKTYHRWVANLFLMPFSIILAFCLSFMLSFQLIKVAEIIFGDIVPLSTSLGLLGRAALTLLPLATPLSILFASLYAMSRLSRDSEYIALKSVGVAPFKVFGPIGLCSILIGIVLYLLSQNVTPESKRYFNQKIMNIQSKSLLASFEGGEFFTKLEGMTLFSQQVKEKGSLLEKVFISYKPKKSDITQLVMAKKGRILWEDNWLQLHLSLGNLVRLSDKSDQVEKIEFSEYRIPVLAEKAPNSIIARGSSLSGEQIRQRLADPEKTIKGMGIEDFLKMKFEYFNRVNLPILCFLFSLLGFALGVTSSRGKGTNSAYLMISLIAYYGSFFGLVSMAKKQTLPMEAAVFLPSMILFLWSLFLYRKSHWNS